MRNTLKTNKIAIPDIDQSNLVLKVRLGMANKNATSMKYNAFPFHFRRFVVLKTLHPDGECWHFYLLYFVHYCCLVCIDFIESA